jgi:hypothetical protein
VTQQIIHGVFIMLVMAWAYVLVGALVEASLRATGTLVVTYYKSKQEWLTALDVSTSRITKEKEQ